MQEVSRAVAQTQIYWNKRYAANGNSGPGSVGLSRAWKWGVITRYRADYENSSVLDVGCGDLSFWEQRELPASYVGIDMSEVVIHRNQATYGSSTAHFINCRAEERQPISAPVVFCFDVLFHVMDEQQYVAILENLCAYSQDYLFVYTWIRNPFRDPLVVSNLVRRLKFRDIVNGIVSGHDRYQKYRDFSLYLPIFEARGFRLEAVELPGMINPYAAMMVFRIRNGR
jgi:SAM-dependent methyltransferase